MATQVASYISTHACRHELNLGQFIYPLTEEGVAAQAAVVWIRWRGTVRRRLAGDQRLVLRRRGVPRGRRFDRSDHQRIVCLRGHGHGCQAHSACAASDGSIRHQWKRARLGSVCACVCGGGGEGGRGTQTLYCFVRSWGVYWPHQCISFTSKFLFQTHMPGALVV